MPRSQVNDVFRLTPMQQGMLFQMLAHLDSQLYFEQMTCTLVGDLDLPAFTAAWQGAVDRHPMLRAGFRWQGVSHPVQIVYDEAEVEVLEEDWRSLAPEEQESRFQRYLTEDRQRGFDLGRPPLTRIRLFRTAAQRRRMVWSTAHLVIDAWCVSILLREVLTRYRASLHGQTTDFPPATSYRDFVVWTERLDLEAAEKFWRQQLRGFRTPNALVSEVEATALAQGGRPKEGEGPEEGHDRLRHTISREVTEGLDDLVRRQRLTRHSLAAGAWALLLGLYDRAEDVVFGVVCSGRPPGLAGIETVVGLFINTLPVRLQLPRDMPFPAWVRSVQGDLARLRRFEASPLGKVQEWSEMPRGRSLFDSILVFFNVVDPALLKGPDLAVTEVQDIARSNFPLAVRVYPEEPWTLEMIFDRSRFDPGTITAKLQDFGALLTHLAARPESTLGELRQAVEEAGRDRRQQRQRKRKAAFAGRLKGLRAAPSKPKAAGGRST